MINKKRLLKNLNISLYTLIFLMIYHFMDTYMVFNDPDSFWHLELGREMIKNGEVLFKAIHTFAGDNLTYIPQEAGFQFIIGFLYNIGGWNAVYLIIAVSLLLISLGIYRLGEMVFLEKGYKMNPFFLFLILPIIMLIIFFLYIRIRPQAISSALTIWFLIYLIQLKNKPDLKLCLKLGVISFLISNIHAGVWPILPVLFVMYVIDRLFYKKFNKYSAIAGSLIICGGLLSICGFQSIYYFLVVKSSGFSSWINEWQPIDFAYLNVYLIIMMIFILSIYFIKDRNVFDLLLILGTLYLGLANYKQSLYLFLFLPYFVAKLMCEFNQDIFKSIDYLPRKFAVFLILTAVAINLAQGLIMPYQKPIYEFPVQEMDYIFKEYGVEDRPKVMADYVVSGYIMYRGGDILADGRFDPFVLNKTKDYNGWTAFERSAFLHDREALLKILDYDNPDYLILQSNDGMSNKENKIREIEDDLIIITLGTPEFIGAYGYVWCIKDLK